MLRAVKVQQNIRGFSSGIISVVIQHIENGCLWEARISSAGVVQHLAFTHGVGHDTE